MVMSDIIKVVPAPDGVCLFCNAETNIQTVAINKSGMNIITFDICDTCRVNLGRGLLPEDSCIVHADLATMES